MEAPRQASLTVLDASALIALLVDEPARTEVERLMRRRPAPLVSAVNLAEVFYRLVRVHNGDPEQVSDKIDLLMVGGLEVQPFWPPDARSAAAIRARFYHRTRSPISMADCSCIATALSQHAQLATTDGPLARVATKLGVGVIALPDSRGQRPRVSLQ